MKRTYDEEDVAVAVGAFHSLCRAISVPESIKLGDRIDLWKLLVVIADRKISNRIRDENRACRSSLFRDLTRLGYVHANPSEGTYAITS